jgi:hypothetical protein
MCRLGNVLCYGIYSLFFSKCTLRYEYGGNLLNNHNISCRLKGQNTKIVSIMYGGEKEVS